MKNKPLIVDLSLDLDFFIRMLPEWDFENRECPGSPEEAHIFKVMLWDARYMGEFDGTDFASATDPTKYADFMPLALFHHLKEKGLEINPKTPRRVGFADSHRFAFDFFNQGRKPDVMLNIDAHHDFWFADPRDTASINRAHLNCGNWGTYLWDRWNKKNADVRWIQLNPKWRAPKTRPADPPLRPIEDLWFETWDGFDQPAVLRHIFLCRSPEWMPPIYDPMFEKLMYALAAMGNYDFLEPMAKRPFTTFERVRTAYEGFVTMRQAFTEPKVEKAEPEFCQGPG